MNYKVNKIISKFENYEYVSFDLFDTLVKRDVSSSKKIFCIVENEYYKKYNKKINNFLNDRILAEKEAINKFENREPNIDEIYQCFKDYQKDDLDKLKEIEVNTEIDFCNINNLFFPIYDFCLKSKKKILITSDMYLNKKYIEKILKKCNISYDYLFLSNEERCSKYTGELYKNILKKLNITSKQIIHIGDSKRADFINPRRFGIKSILIPKHVDNLRYLDKDKLDILDYNILDSFINNRINPENDIYYRIGYETLGSLLYGYTKWLINNLKENNIEKIFFLSREGNLLKKAFDLMNDNENIKSNYLYVSRRSTFPGLFNRIEKFSELLEVFQLKDISSFKEIFSKMNLNEKTSQKILNEFNLTNNTKISERNDMDLIFNKIKLEVKDDFEGKNKLLIQYLKQEGISNNVAISDIGWRGTMQNSIQNILNIKLFGYYVGLKDESISENMTNYIINNNLSYNINIRPFLLLFESFFLAQHGTTLEYKLNDNGKVEPILDTYEYDNDAMKVFKSIQDGSLDFVKDFYNSNIKLYIENKSEIMYNSFMRLGLNPTKEDINLFSNIDYLDTYKIKFASPDKLYKYIICPKKLYVDFRNSNWKIGFLKKLFKININYHKLYKKLLNIEEKNK